MSLAPSVTETLFAVGAGGEIVGVSDLSDYPPEARAIDRIGSYLKPNVEAVVAHRPDLVIGVPSPGNREAVDALGDLGFRVVIVEEGPKLADVFASIEKIASEVGRPEAGGAIVAGIRRQIARVHARLGDAPRRRVLMIVGQNPLVAVGDGNLLDEILSAAGAENVARGLGRWPRLSIEVLVKSDPYLIIDSSMGEESPAGRSFYEGLGLTAIREARLRAIRVDEVLRPGPRVGEGLEKIARMVHPEIFAPEAGR